MDLANESQQRKARRKQFKWENGTTVWLCEFKAMLTCYCSLGEKVNNIEPHTALGARMPYVHAQGNKRCYTAAGATWEITKQCTGVGNGTEVRERSVVLEARTGVLVAVPFTGGSCSAIWVEHAALPAAELVHFQMPTVTIAAVLACSVPDAAPAQPPHKHF